MQQPVDRRRFLSGRVTVKPDPVRHISSALVLAFPERRNDVMQRIAKMSRTEVHGIENGKIVIVLEGASVGEIGERLTTISLMDGVLAANLVFEQLCEPDSEGTA